MFIGARIVNTAIVKRTLPGKDRQFNRVSAYKDWSGSKRFVLEGRDAMHKPWERLHPRLSVEILEQLCPR